MYKIILHLYLFTKPSEHGRAAPLVHLSVRGCEEASYPPHKDGKQGELVRQREDALLQLGQEAWLLRAHLHPARRRGRPQELLQDPEEVARVAIPVQRKLVQPLESVRTTWLIGNFLQDKHTNQRLNCVKLLFGCCLCFLFMKFISHFFVIRD